MKKHKWAAAFTACLLAFTVYISMDTFVLSSAYQTDATEVNLSSIRSAMKTDTDTVPEVVSTGDDRNEIPDGTNKAADGTNEAADDGNVVTNDVNKAADGMNEAADDENKASEGVNEAPDKENESADDSISAESSASPVGSGHSRKPGDQPDGSSQSTGDPSDETSSESSRHRKKPGEGHGGPGGEHGDGQGGGHGSGKGGNSSTASTTTIKNFDEEEALASAAEVTTDNSGSS